MAESLLLVDDEPELLSVLRHGFEQHDYQIRTASDGPAALAQAVAQPPDLIVLDLMLPGMSGLEVCRALRADERLRGIPVIILTARHETLVKVMGLDLGADDYVTKPCNFDELRARIRARLRRPVPTDVAPAALALRLDPSRREVVRDDQAVPLTRREYELFELLLGKVGRLVDRDTIVREVWGGACSPDANIVDVYIRRLRRKLEAADYGGRIRTVWGIGYLLEPEAAAAEEPGA